MVLFAPADLTTLLDRLRAAGLRVGIEDSLRVFLVVEHLLDADEHHGLRELLLATLIKSPAQLAPFEEVFAAWTQELESRQPTLDDDTREAASPRTAPRTRSQPASKPVARSTRWAWLLALAVFAGICLLGLWFRAERTPSTGPPDVGHTQAELSVAPEDLSAAAVPLPVESPPPPQLPKQWVPLFEVQPPGVPPLLFVGLALSVLGTGLGLALYLGLRNKRYTPPEVPPPTRAGPRHLQPTLAYAAGPSAWVGSQLRLLDERGQEAMVWGIGRFVSEQLTHRLDVPATILATAQAGGLPRLRFLHARHDREVWLWVDVCATQLTLEYGPLGTQLVHELRVTLQQNGLPVEEAQYWGVPDRLTRVLPSGHLEGEFAASEVEERRDAALIVLLTDGRLLRDALQSDQTLDETRALLRQLAHFPHLAFCDLARDSYGLAGLLLPFELTVLQPEQVAKFLGGVPLDPPTKQPDQLTGDLRLWAAACALWPYPLDDELLFWIRDALGLDVPAAHSTLLKQEAQILGDRVQWTGVKRVERLRFLGQLAQTTGSLDTLPARLAQTPLGACLRLVRTGLHNEAAARQQRDETVPWLGTHAEQELLMHQALLDLWDRPHQASLVLHSLSTGWLREEIIRHLSERGARDPQDPADDLIRLPWERHQLAPPLLGWLEELGFGRAQERPTVIPQRPGRLYAAWAASVGIVLAGLCTLGQALWQSRHPSGEPTVTQQKAPPDAGNEQPPDLATDLATAPDLQPPAPPAWSCPYEEYKEPKSGMVFVKVCGGDFKMGSEKNDQDAQDNEKPAYPVHIDTFWIGKYEVSNAQYRKKEPAHRSEFDGEELPVQDVDWTQARAFCQSIDGDLPTEAEWEYAARGPEDRKYPWGKAEPQPGQATFWWNKNKPDAIVANPRGRGPFGTLNQAGNVWEWVMDCWDNAAYEKRKERSELTTPALPVGNPVDDRPGCDGRVLRGGSFAVVPWNLRSAVRSWDLPDYRNRYRGFRCVRGSQRQR